jgi:peptidoglycan/LPS O-acetylase OafA/YrhL
MTAWDGRRNNFDFMRLALSVMVIYSHAFVLEQATEKHEPLMRATHGQQTLGGFAVESFFIMSGFLIAASAQHSASIVDFLKKRVRRIYPGFIVAMLVEAALLLPLSGGHFAASSAPMRLWDFITHTLRLVEFPYVEAFRHNEVVNVINGSTWSIAYEFWCYLMVAALTWIGLLRRRRLVLGLFLAAWLIGIYFRYKSLVLWGGWVGVAVGPVHFWARLLPLYLAGVAFYLFRDRIPLNGWLAAAAALAMLATHWLWFTWAIVFPVAGAYLLFWFAFTPWVRLHDAGRFGDFSYGTYLYGFPIEQLLVQYAGNTITPLQLACLATPLTLLAAFASWYGVERRFLRPARRKETIAHAVRAEAQLVKVES